MWGGRPCCAPLGFVSLDGFAGIDPLVVIPGAFDSCRSTGGVARCVALQSCSVTGSDVSTPMLFILALMIGFAVNALGFCFLTVLLAGFRCYFLHRTHGHRANPTS